MNKEKYKALIENKIIVNPKTDCWEVRGFKDKDGYGHIGRKRAHRAAYEIYKGEIPPGMLVCHSCDNPSCCNPDHLFLGTQKENIADMMRKGRKDPRFGTRNTQNKLSEKQVLEIFKSNENQYTIAKHYNIDQSTVSNIKTGKLWGWLTKGGERFEKQVLELQT